MGKTITRNGLEKKRKDVDELLEIMERVPDNKKERVLGIIEGFALENEREQAAV